jgi:hypothetical protein
VSLLARSILRTERLVSRYAPTLHPVWAGLCLGLLRRPDLHALDQACFTRRRSYRSPEHNLRGLMPWEQAAFDAYFAGRTRIGIIGVGGGREVLALWRLGREPEGFECNPELFDSAAALLSAEGCPFPVRFLPRDAAPAGVGPYDAAVIGWGAYMLVQGRAARVALLAGMRRLVPEGAPLLVSFFTREKDDARARRVAGIAATLRRIRRGQPLELGDDLQPVFVHRFTREEIAQELAEGGFMMARFEPQGPGPLDSGWAVGLARPTGVS